jgi:hypothetical protein
MATMPWCANTITNFPVLFTIRDSHDIANDFVTGNSRA